MKWKSLSPHLVFYKHPVCLVPGISIYSVAQIDEFIPDAWVLLVCFLNIFPLPSILTAVMLVSALSLSTGLL